MVPNQPQNLPIKGIIFDLDGTLIKSVVNFPRMKQKMIEYIHKLPIANTKYTITQTTNEIIHDLNNRMTKQGISQSERDDIFNKISEILTKVEFENLDKVELLPGVKEFVAMCWENKIKMGILTRASRKYMSESLRRTGILKYFNVILSRDEFGLLKAKPNLYALNYTIKELALNPENILFVGDHKIDFMCAKEGRVRFAGVLSGSFNRDMFKELGVDIIVENFYELGNLVKNNNKINS